MITVLLGLAGLGLVVLFHEVGHYIAAKAVGIEVETFSIGWGPKIAGFRRGGTEWQIAAFPIGGYCSMRGQDSFRRAAAEHLEMLPSEPGSFYGATPLRRIAVAIAGPAANILFAAIVFSLVAAIGYQITSTPSRIILASEVERLATTMAVTQPATTEKALAPASSPTNLLTSPPTGSSEGDTGAKAKVNPADVAGLLSGDTILSLGGKPVRDYADIQEIIGSSPGKALMVQYSREGETRSCTLTPMLDTATGAGRVGIFSWVDPVIDVVSPGSAAAIAGLAPGDRILEVDGQAVRHSMDIHSILARQPEKIHLVGERSAQRFETTAILSWSESGQESGLGIAFRTTTRTIRSEGFVSAIATGFRETWNTSLSTLKGIGLLFQGVNLLSALSGPARITWMVGKATTESVRQNGAAGLVQVFNFLAFLSVGLFIMNLLPIPALDGGLIIVFIIELIRRKSLKAKTIMNLQLAGTVFIFALFLVATLGDILFFTKL